MKKTFLLSIAAFLTTLSFADTLNTDQSHYTLNDMTKESFSAFSEGQSENIILLETGTVLPLEFIIEGSSFAFQGEKNIGSLLVKEPFYMILKNNEPYFSKDKTEWKSFFHFFGGQIFCGLAVDEIREQPYTLIKIDISQK